MPIRFNSGDNSRFWDALNNGISTASRAFPGANFINSLLGSPQTKQIGRFTPAADPFSRPSGPVGSALRLPKPGGIDDILRRLEELQNPDRYLGDESLLRKQAEAMASAQYDPAMGEIRAAMNSARSRADRNSQQLGSMYGALSKSMMDDIAPIQQQYAQTKETTANQYSQLQDQIKNQYAQSQAEQEAMLQRLNIQAAAPDVFDQQQVDRDFFVNNAATEGQTAQTALSQEEAGDVGYTRKGAEIARYEGTGRQADLMNQLSDLLAGYEGQLGSLSAAKSATIEGSLAQLLSEGQKGAVDRAQRDFENYIKMLQVGSSLSQDKNQVTDTKSPAQVGARAMSLGLDVNSAQNLQNVFLSALGNDEVLKAGLDPTYHVSLPGTALAARVVEAGRRQGLSSAELNALQSIALEYFGPK